MNVLSLRTQLETTLVEQLGIYTLGNGMTTPAISVRTSGESLPAGTEVSGLEVIIRRDPDLTPIDTYSQPDAFRIWTVLLVDWDNTNTLSTAAWRIMRDFPITTMTPLTVPEGLGPQSQMRLEIRTNPDGEGET